MPLNLPEYVERGGGQVWRPPYAARQAELLGLIIPADTARIDAMLQRDLVHPSGGALDYRCAHSHVVVVCANIGRMASLDQLDAQRGGMPEQELSIWCLAADMTAKERLVWYLPYVYADGGRPVAAGREVYGYPKELGTFDTAYPSIFTTNGASTTISAVGLDSYSPTSTAGLLPTATVSRSPGVGLAPPPTGQSFADEFVGSLFPGGLGVSATLPSASGAGPSATITLGGNTPAGPNALLPWIKPAIKKLTGGGLGTTPEDLVTDLLANPALVFLKQFRDATCATKACYQAVVEASLSPDPVGATFTPLDPALFGLTLHDWASDPIASELGIAASAPITPTRAFHARLNFDVLAGLEVWRAPT